MPEDEIRDVMSGQMVQLKAQMLPFETFSTRVERIAARAHEAEADPYQNTIVVNAVLDRPHAELRPGMTSYARIARGTAPIALEKILRYVRTEFWW